jgi:small nuclear ribonucleoprotein (snRNP)-like protein
MAETSMNAFALLAEEAGAVARAQGQIGGVLKFILDNPFALAVTLVFVIAVIAAFVAARKRDRCLKKFRDYPVSLQRQDGRMLWGRLRVFSKGLELLFAHSAEEPRKRSFLIYESELSGLMAAYRFLDCLEGKDASRRARQAGLLVHLKLPSRLWRSMRNLFNTFRDAFVQAMGLTIQQAAKVTPNPLLATAGQTPITTLGTALGSDSGFAYEPMLEQYIGLPVVMDMAGPAEAGKPPLEYRGALGEYSDKYIMLVGVTHRFSERLPLDGPEGALLENRVRVRPAEGRLVIENRSPVVVRVDTVEAEGGRREIDEAIPPGETAEVTLPEGVPAEGAMAVLSFERTFDVIVPRARGTVRHAGV